MSKPALPLAMRYKNPARNNRAQDLRNDIWQESVRGKTTAGPQPDRNCRIEVTSGDMSNGKSHRQYGQTESQCNAENTDARRAGKVLRKAPRCRTLQEPARMFR